MSYVAVASAKNLIILPVYNVQYRKGYSSQTFTIIARVPFRIRHLQKREASLRFILDITANLTQPNDV